MWWLVFIPFHFEFHHYFNLACHILAFWKSKIFIVLFSNFLHLELCDTTHIKIVISLRNMNASYFGGLWKLFGVVFHKNIVNSKLQRKNFSEIQLVKNSKSHHHVEQFIVSINHLVSYQCTHSTRGASHSKGVYGPWRMKFEWSPTYLRLRVTAYRLQNPIKICEYKFHEAGISASKCSKIFKNCCSQPIWRRHQWPPLNIYFNQYCRWIALLVQDSCNRKDFAVV